MYISSSFTSLATRLSEPRRWMQVLLGPRQVGKTTGATSLQENLKELHGISSLFVSADEPVLHDRIWLEQQWGNARRECKSNANSSFVLIVDEIQKIDGWSETVKRLWDEDTRQKRNLKVLLLGSATLLIQQGLTESLAGRFEITRIQHWSYLEMKQAFGLSLDEWIFFGGYPGSVALRKDASRWATYIRDSLIETTVSRDILLIHKIEKPALLRRVFQLACLHSGQILSYQKMLGQLQDAGNATTIAHYLEVLEQAGLVGGISKFSGNIVRQKASSPKLQVFNMALMSALQHNNFEQTRSDPEKWGRHVESAVGAHLANQVIGTMLNLSYWNQSSKEVDFVIQRGEQILGIEVKSGQTKKSIPGKKEFLKLYPQSKFLTVGDAYDISIEEFLKSRPESFF